MNPRAKSSPTKPCDRAMMIGRLKKAEQFFGAAETIRESVDGEAEMGDSFVTLCVHAGIAAADAICCSALHEHAQGESHVEAVQLIERVRPDGRELGRALATLLALKTRAGYSAQAVTADQCKRARRSALKLTTAARDRVTA